MDLHFYTYAGVEIPSRFLSNDALMNFLSENDFCSLPIGSGKDTWPTVVGMEVEEPKSLVDSNVYKLMPVKYDQMDMKALNLECCALMQDAANESGFKIPSAFLKYVEDSTFGLYIAAYTDGVHNLL